MFILHIHAYRWGVLIFGIAGKLGKLGKLSVVSMFYGPFLYNNIKQSLKLVDVLVAN